MPQEDIILIANVLQVAHADGQFTGSEKALIEAIRKDLGVKKGDLAAAQKLVDSGTYSLKPVGSFSDQVRNLELALRVAYVDGDLGVIENDIVTAFAAAVGLGQEQLERMRAEVIAQGSATALLCSSCSAENSSDSKFCSKCGSSLAIATEEVQVKYEIPRTGITVEFAESTGVSFPKALEIARAAPEFHQCVRNKKIWQMASFPSGMITDVTPLAKALSGLRNRSLYIDGEERQWDEVFAFVWCSAQRDQAYRPVEYCFGKDDNRINPWGCRHSRMEWTEWATWFCYGQWEKSGFISKKVQWRFDKNRIKHELSTNVFRFRYCPHINSQLFELVLQGIPDVVAPGADSDWDFHQHYTEVPGAIKVVQRERSAGMSFTSEFWADGVKPKDLKVLVEILTKAFTEMKADLGPVRELLK